MAERSPNWKRPSEIMKMHRRKKRFSTQKPVLKVELATSSSVFHDITSSRLNKRKNPFSREDDISAKRVNMEDSTDTSATSGRTDETVALFKILDTANQVQCFKRSPNDVENTEKVILEEGKITPARQSVTVDQDGQDTPVKGSLTKKTEIEKSDKIISRDHLPVDWSLKVKLRILSESSLLWTSQLRTAEEAKGISEFVRCSHSRESLSPIDQKAQLKTNCMYWVYPSLPWLRLFPRITAESKLSKSGSLLLGEEVQSSLQADWAESFTSAFHQLRAQRCPYFYMCTHQFTVLFRCAGIAGQNNINALVTPTTRGFREALKSEEIEFDMPLLRKKKSTETDVSASPCPGGEKESNENNSEQTHLQENAVPAQSDLVVEQEEDCEDDLICNDEGASVWLESIGLDRKQFPSLEPHKVKLQRDGFRAIDNRPESLVFVKGGDVQGLFNFLLNCCSCTATSGPQAGIPPTILAPTAFIGARLSSHKVKHSIAKQTAAQDSVKQSHVLEIMGPILPHHVQNLTHLLRETQDSNFSITFNTHEPTAPLNVLNSDSGEESSPSLSRTVPWESLGCDAEKHQTFCESSALSDRSVGMKELLCTEEGFSWAV